MTQNVIDSVIDVANVKNVPLGFCVSRRQIDYQGGYVKRWTENYTTWSFISYVRKKSSNIIIERDHAGIMQNDPNDIIYKDLQSIAYDSWSGIDLIHIDPWKAYSNFNDGVRETVNNIFLSYQKNNNVCYEIGTEEAIRPFAIIELENMLHILYHELGPIFNKIKYVVTQSGVRLSKTQNIGIPNMQRLKDTVELCKSYGLLTKEHNGDYLSDEDIKVRFANGLDSINIAPEFGVLETKVLLDHIKSDTDFDKIFLLCLNGQKWRKWVPEDFNPHEHKRELIEICGHYHNKEIKDIVDIDDDIIKEKIKERLYHLLEL